MTKFSVGDEVRFADDVKIEIAEAEPGFTRIQITQAGEHATSVWVKPGRLELVKRALPPEPTNIGAIVLCRSKALMSSYEDVRWPAQRFAGGWSLTTISAREYSWQELNERYDVEIIDSLGWVKA